MIFTFKKHIREKLSRLKGQELHNITTHSIGVNCSYNADKLSYSFEGSAYFSFRVIEQKTHTIASFSTTFFETSIYSDLCLIRPSVTSQLEREQYEKRIQYFREHTKVKNTTLINLRETIQAIDVYGVSTILNLEEHDLGVTAQSPNVPIELDLLLLFHCESGNKIAVHGTQIHGLMSITVYFKNNTAAFYEWIEHKTNMFGLPYYRKKYSL